MADVKDSIPHIERTAQDQRQAGSYNANISRIELVNKRIRLIRLDLEQANPPLRHLPGQYIDLQIPNIPTVGGFTITSPPQTAIHRPPSPKPNTGPGFPNPDSGYIDLAIQISPNNPPAAYLWQEPAALINAPVIVRVGGNFTYPPATLSLEEFRTIENIVFVAGGVGINPIMSMVSAMDVLGPGRLGGMVKRVRLLYSSKQDADENGQKQDILFHDKLSRLAEKYKGSKEVDYQYTLFETGSGGKGRITHEDLFEAIGTNEIRKKTLVYVCGVPSMTDEFVELLRAVDGLDERRVLCEKWW